MLRRGAQATGHKREFGAYLEEALRDRFVCGLKNEGTQKRLLSEADLTFQKALEIAQGMEAAAKNAKELQSQTAPGVVPFEEVVHNVTSTNCYRCGRANHIPAQCPFKEAKCHNCGKTGHIRRTCRSKPKRASRDPRQDWSRRQDSVKLVHEGDPDSDDSYEEYGLHQVTSKVPSRPLELDVEVEGQRVTMELDTGAAVSLVSESTYRHLFPGTPLLESTAQLCTYSGEPLSVVGEREVLVRYGNQSEKLPLIVLKEDGPSLFGRNWLQCIKLDWQEIHQVQGSTVQGVLDRHPEVFREELGTLKDFKAKIHIDPNAKPRFCKARSVPYALRTKVEEELDRLVADGVLEAVQFSDWAAPIVPVLKSDKKTVRICGDFKLTVNQASKLDHYPIPKIEDLFAQLAGGKSFTKLDLSQAYQQLVLEEESKDLTTINTQRGLFRFNRLPFGISSAPGIFQRVMESILKGIPGVVVYIDDILSDRQVYQ